MSGFKLPANWEENEQYLAQVGHSLGGCLLIVLATLFSCTLLPTGGVRWIPVIATLAIGISAAMFKEFYLDMHPPENCSLANSEMDFWFYLLGEGVGMLISLLAICLAK